MTHLTHHLAPYHDLALVLAVMAFSFIAVCWAMRNQGGQL
jgi:uncharacterized membrane protein